MVRPKSFVLACADGNSAFDKLNWSTWAPGLASAKGTLVQNDCTPYCAAGHFHSYPVRLRFDRVKRTDKGRLFSRWTATFPGRAPLGRHVESDPDFLPSTVRVLG